MTNKHLSGMARTSLWSIVWTLCALCVANAQSSEMVSIFGGEQIAVGDTVHVGWTVGNGEVATSLVLWSVDKGSWTELSSTLGTADRDFQWVVSDEQIGPQNRIGLRDANGMVLTLCRGYFAIVESAPQETEQLSTVRYSAGGSNSDYALALYPNPAMNASRLSWGRSISGTVRLVSQEGNVVRTYPLSNQDAIDINLDGLSAGAYIVVVNSQAGVSKSTTLVVQ